METGEGARTDVELDTRQVQQGLEELESGEARGVSGTWVIAATVVGAREQPFYQLLFLADVNETAHQQHVLELQFIHAGDAAGGAAAAVVLVQVRQAHEVGEEQLLDRPDLVLAGCEPLDANVWPLILHRCFHLPCNAMQCKQRP